MVSLWSITVSPLSFIVSIHAYSFSHTTSLSRSVSHLMTNSWCVHSQSKSVYVPLRSLHGQFMVSSWSVHGQSQSVYGNHGHLIVSSRILQQQFKDKQSLHWKILVSHSHFMFHQDQFILNSWSVHGQSLSPHCQYMHFY